MNHVILLLLIAVMLLPACNKKNAEDEHRFDTLDTEDIGAAVDAGLSTAADEQAAVRGPEVAGVLPEGFPPDAPLFTPSSVVDFGEVGGGRYFVEFDTMAPLAEVQGMLIARLGTQGWTPLASGEYSKPPYRIRLEFREMSPGTRIRYEFGI